MNIISFSLPYHHSHEQFLSQLQENGLTGLSPYFMVKKSLDARKKKDIRWVYSVSLSDPRLLLKRDFPNIGVSSVKPVIIGSGPAGLFTAYWLLQYNVPSIILEQGAPIGERTRKIASFIRHGILDEKTNICYGAGGAGAWSDGKLFTRTKSPFAAHVRDILIRFGALEEIRFLSNPHLGSDRIRQVVSNMLHYLEEKGVEVCFHTQVLDFHVKDKKILGVITNQGKMETDTIFLATGHSSRTIYDCLQSHQALEFKPFAMGLRMVHPASLISRIQYGRDDFPLPATYRLAHTWKKPVRRGVYTFCMCPGGYVLNSSTDPHGIVCNGMSNYSKNSRFSNSAIVVNIESDDLQGNAVLKGLEFQKNTEERFAGLANSKGSVHALPAMRLVDFLKQRPSSRVPLSGCLHPIKPGSLYECFPDFMNEALINGLEIFNRKMKGLIHPDAVLIGAETRTSSPFRVMRDPVTFQSLLLSGLYPLGEGAGYAGGIVSSAVDGINGAEAYIRAIQKKSGGFSH
ncbi:MAG: hypothetical protein JW774_09545 [Candidatus Aureabacteria bacterium]|nr:hypothetical protein [Candidatus Auribacterota bacterium]